MTVTEGAKLRERAIDQWTRELPIKAKRGNILDRNGVILAGSNGTYSVYVRPRCVTDVDSVCNVLANILKKNSEELRKKLKTANSSELLVSSEVDKETINMISSYSLDGVYFSIDNSRTYPFDDALCQTLGYVSSDGHGQSGLEEYYDNLLAGKNGEILYESDLTGTDLNEVPHYVSAINGYDLKLTIDYEIQLICENQMQIAMDQYTPKSAKVIVLEPSSGKVLAMAQKPSYDLNNLPRDNIEKLIEWGRNGLISDSYEPGSTFKVITSSANIEEYNIGNVNAYSPDYVFPSSRYRIVQGRKIKCWSTHNNGKHANEKLAEALNNSCNPIFVDIGLSLGKSTMYKYIQKFNFGKTTGIDFQGEALGMLLPEGAVTDGDIARIAFGQSIAVTPIQLISAISASINGGIYYQPYLLEEVYDKNGVISRNYPIARNRVISEKTSKFIAGCLENVVAVGSGKQAYIEGYRVGGKTGTAQKYENGVISAGKYVMSFVGFFPANDPQYIALVIVDEPIGGQYGSTVAAPICKNIFDEIIKAKNIKQAV